MKTIVFVHGMFQSDRSWDHWVSNFEVYGYRCIVPVWPHHEGNPKSLRENPPNDLGNLRLEEIVAHVEDIVRQLPEKPIVIGHSVGGLIVQLLCNKNLVSVGVAISPVAPNTMLSTNWDFYKSNAKITNAFTGDGLIHTTFESFFGTFCNTLNNEQARIAFEETAVHESRNVLRDCMMEPGNIDLEMPHAPLLFIAGDKDRIIPCKLVEKNSKAYKDKQSIAAFRSFPNRSHYICGEPGWKEVVRYSYRWLQEQTTNPVKEPMSLFY